MYICFNCGLDIIFLDWIRMHKYRIECNHYRKLIRGTLHYNNNIIIGKYRREFSATLGHDKTNSNDKHRNTESYVSAAAGQRDVEQTGVLL